MQTRKVRNKGKGLYNNIVEEEIAKAIKEGKPLTGREGVLTPIIKRALEASLEGEITSHLQEDEKSNRRNGKSSKRMRSTYGSFELETPRDRNSSFEPQIVKKRQTILTEELDNKVIKLFSLGMSYEDISSNIQEIYGMELAPSQITAITDKLIPIIKEWQNRPLERVYPIIFLDGMYSKAREDNRVITKVVYNVIGINTAGYKDVLGTYISESEGANFWLSVLTDLHNRGIEDILIACIDGLKGFPEAIHSIFPRAEIQLCVIHQIRNSLKYIAWKDKKEFATDLKLIYKADTQDAAESNLLYLSEKWERKYPIVIKSWQENWELLSTYFKYNKQIRKIIYTTNIIEGFHRVVRKFTKTKGAFSNEMALLKMVYCGIQAITRKWSMPLPEWALTLSQLDIIFPNRLKLNLGKKFDTVN